MAINHLAIIMDGNGRWAKQRNQPRTFGHQAGVKSVRNTIKAAISHGISYLSLFAFSSENWNRPQKEVSRLMDLFIKSIDKETPELNTQGVKLNFIGDLNRFSDVLQNKMHAAAAQEPVQHRLIVNIAVNYGGQWDIVQAARKAAIQMLNQGLATEDLDQIWFQQHLMLSDQPAVDILIRTGGEYRISNFLLWQSAYAELFFEDVLWPDFDEQCLQSVLDQYEMRDRRFGRISE